MSKKRGLGKFICGAIVGSILGVLFAPKKGSETRKELREKLEEFIKVAREIDIEELKAKVEEKVEEIREELDGLDGEKVIKIAKKKAIVLREKTEELVDMLIEKGTPVLIKAAEEVRKKVNLAADDIIKRLEKGDK